MARKVATSSRDEMSPQEVLFAFFAAMCKWERHAFRRSEKIGEAEDDALRQQRDVIISEFCTPRRRAYSEPLAFGDPPEYDPKVEQILKVVEESTSRVVVYTQRTDELEEKRRYVLLRKKGRWLLDSWQWEAGKKWQRGII